LGAAGAALNCHVAETSERPKTPGDFMKIRMLKNLTMPVLCLALASLAQAQDADGKDALYVKSLAASCANCHGTNGRAVAGSSVTSLAGLERNYIVAQMTAFRNGARPATVMHQISKGFNDAQISSLAAYFAVQKK
jgi:sulfide dehydrogenase cytochrome subunit